MDQVPEDHDHSGHSHHGLILIPCIAVSAGYILLTCLLAELSRWVVRASLGPGLLKIALGELVAGAELCGCGFELIIIADNYGIGCYALFLFALTIWWSHRWEDSNACPYVSFEECALGSMGVLEVLVRTVAATIGGIAVFQYVRILWDLQMAETHVGRSHSAAFDRCSADLQISVLNGALVEGVATMLCRLTSKFLSDSNMRYSSAIDSFIATSLVVAAFNYSGGYYNPVLATGLKWGCRGHTNVEHVVVYWLGASLGALLSIYIYPLIKPDLKTKAD